MKKVLLITAIALLAITTNAQHISKTMTYDGLERNYMQYTPSESPDGTAPVLFLLHGLGDDCANFAQLNFEILAPNWIIVTPEATNAVMSIMGYEMEMGNAWAAGVGSENITYMGMSLGSIELNADVDDDGFLMALLDTLEANNNVDTDSVFFAGFSLGGFMANKMAIKHTDRITAIASVSGTIGHFQAFEPTANISTMHIHGTADEMIAYTDASCYIEGIDIGSVGTGAEQTVENWRNYNQCSATFVMPYMFEDTKDDGLTFEQYTYKNEETGKKTVFIKVNNGDHTWYNGINNDIDYNTEIYKFFIGEENSTTSIDENISESVNIFPNPASNQVKISVNENTELLIYDSLLREVANYNLNSGENTIETSNFADGVYFFNIGGNVSKVVIRR